MHLLKWTEGIIFVGVMRNWSAVRGGDQKYIECGIEKVGRLRRWHNKELGVVKGAWKWGSVWSCKNRDERPRERKRGREKPNWVGRALRDWMMRCWTRAAEVNAGSRPLFSFHPVAPLVKSTPLDSGWRTNCGTGILKTILEASE